ncbi:14679_t:CDS:2, partial [Cetraspora pellucida]
MAEKFGFAMFNERFVDHANKIIASWQNLKNSKDEYESKIKFELGEENKYWCATCSKEVEKETDRQRQERINKAVKDATRDLEGSAKKDKEKEITEQESKIIKDDLNSFTKAEQIKRYQFGDNQLLRERIRELGDQLYNNHVELGNVVGGSLLNMVNTLDAIKEEINAAEIRALKDEAYQVRKDLQQATLDVKALEGQIDALRQKISSIGSGSSSGSSFSFPSAAGILSSTSTTVRNAIVGELEGQLTALAISSGLLSQQVEQLNNQLSEKEQEEERMRLEAEIKSNLIREQNEKINSQESQITNYQQLLKTAESNLKKAQELLNKKEQQLEQLEKEKNLIGEELSLANSKIQELESTLLAANSKIGGLEARIRELENQGDNSE